MTSERQNKSKTDAAERRRPADGGPQSVPEQAVVHEIGLLLDGGHAHPRQIALGAVEFQRENSAIRITGDGFNPLITWERVQQFKGDGLIAIADSQAELDCLRGLGIPFVLAGGRIIRDEFPLVVSDNRALGEQAAQHLVSCGLKKFFFVGPVEWDDERLRHDGFHSEISRAGFKCTDLQIPADHQYGFDTPEYGNETVRRIAEIIPSLQGPVGVFCPSSLYGRAVLSACRTAGLKVPDQVAVMAVNDDPILCETSAPPLSTIVQASTEIGYHAARMISGLLQGHKISDHHLILPPRRLSVRRSTDLLMVGDETVERALRFMRDNAQSQIEIAAIAEEVGVSRRTLELKFRSTLERTPRQELLRMRLDIAKSLLAESDIPITEIALRSGFGSSQVFSSVFKKSLGLTPSGFRLEARARYEVE